MRVSNIKRVITPLIVFAFASLMLVSANWFSSASSALQAQSQTSEAVITSRRALETAIASEKKNAVPEAVRTTDTALFKYKSAVDERLTDIRTTQADLRKRDTSGSLTSQINALEQEYRELESSLLGYVDQVNALRASQKLTLPPPRPAVVFNGGAITINAGASPPTAASPYPSTINVSGLTGTINKVTLTLTNFSTTFPDNIDILLVGPTGVNGIVMSDAGGNTCANCPVTLVLDDTAANPLPNNGPPLDVGLTSGTFQSSNWNSGDTFAAPAPAPTNTAQSFATALAGFIGTDPNGTWSLYVVHDGTSITGTIDSWSLDIDSGAGACTLTCPSDINQAKNPDFCGAVVTYTAPTTSGSCGAVTCSPPSGSSFPVGATTVTCSETGGASCSFTITVTGTCAAGEICNNTPITINTGSPPTAATPYPSDITVSGLTGQIVSKVTVTLPNFSHDFPDDVDILLVGPGGEEATIMSDVGGNNSISSGAPVTLTLDDAAALSLPDSTALTTGTFKPTNINPGGVGDSFPSPAPAPSGASALSVFNGTDPNGTWSLYVVDDGAASAGMLSGWCLNITTTTPTPCMLTCTTDVMQAKDPNFCGAVVTYAAPTTSGTCGTVTCTPPSGSFFPAGATTVSCSETGGASCTFTVTVTGTCPAEQPCNNTSITINDNAQATPYPSDITVSGLTGIVGKVTVTLGSFSHDFPDDVDILLVGPGGQEATIMSDVGGSNPISASNPITLTLDDAAALSLPDTSMLSTGTFKPTNINPGGVGDTFPAPAPTPSGGSALSAFNGSDPNGTWSLYIVDDGMTSSGMLAGGWCLNITTVCGITCPSPITVSNDAGQCGAVVTFAPTTSGDCGTVTCTPPSGSFFPVGMTTVSCSETGGANCSFTVTVNDNESPTVTCPANIGASTATPMGCATVTYTDPTPSDNCPGATVMCDPASGTCFPEGVTTVTCTATDAAGNIGSCMFTVSVAECTVTCPANVTQSNDAGQCSAVINYAAPTTTGDCGTVTCTPPSGSSFPVGTTTVTCSTTAGPSCSFTVTVNDTEAPQITCPPPQFAPLGVVTYPDPTVTDNCPGATFVCNPPSGSTFPAGTTTVTCTATDVAGNTAMCSFAITTFNVSVESGSGALMINTATGDYQFCCGGMIVTGQGRITVRGCTLNLQQGVTETDRRINATIDTCRMTGQATLQMPPGTVKCTVIDKNLQNNTFNCSGSAPLQQSQKKKKVK